jgi:hypothetical protein
MATVRRLIRIRSPQLSLRSLLWSKPTGHTKPSAPTLVSVFGNLRIRSLAYRWQLRGVYAVDPHAGD